MTTVSIKWHHGEITRRFGLTGKSDEDLYVVLMNRIIKLQPDFCSTLYWKDTWGDEIELSSSEELIEAIRNMKKETMLVIFSKAVDDKNNAPQLLLPSSSDNKESFPTPLRGAEDKVVNSEENVRRLFSLLDHKKPSEESVVEDPSNQVDQRHHTIDGVKEMMKSETPDANGALDKRWPHKKTICDKCRSEIHGIRYRCNKRSGHYMCERCVMNREMVPGEARKKI